MLDLAGKDTLDLLGLEEIHRPLLEEHCCEKYCSTLMRVLGASHRPGAVKKATQAYGTGPRPTGGV